MAIEVTFLGTGTSQGVPMIGCCCGVCTSTDVRDKRLRSSILVRTQGVTIVIDTSMDFRQQMLRERVDNLDAVLYTHEHRDHTGGMDDLRAYNYILGRPIDIYCQQRVADYLNREFDYAFVENPYPGVPELNVHLIDSTPFTISGVEIIPIKGHHFMIEVLGYRVGDFVYMTDFNEISEQEKQKLHGAKVIVINALRRKTHVSHFTLSQAMDLIREVQPQKAYLTHMSHQLGLHADLCAELPEYVKPAYDGLKLEIE